MLREQMVSVMFSKPSALNDPFEFLPSLATFCFRPDEKPSKHKNLASFNLSKSGKYLREGIEKHWFVTSLTKTDRNVRMWDQYGGNHTGIKFTFDLASDLREQKLNWMRKVTYSATRRIDISRLANNPSFSGRQNGRLLQRIATRKGRDWEHEEEVGWFLRDDHRPSTDKQLFEKKLVDGKMRAFLKLPHECIKQVTIGYLSPPELLPKVLELRNKYQAPWEVARTVLSLNSFRFDEELIK